MATEKCPVCDWAIEDEGTTVELDGKQITVCCDDCTAKIKADPEKYRTEA